VSKQGRLIYGVGVNDSVSPVYITKTFNGKRKITWVCPAYKTWSNMMRRAYDPSYKEKYPTYDGVSVDTDWHKFSSFKLWWDNQLATEGLSLDKDLKVLGNKTYGSASCVMVPSQINGLLTDRGNARGALPLGVTQRVATGKYMAQIQLGLGKGHKNLGSYDTPEQAHKAWQLGKIEVILGVVKWYENHQSYNKDVVDALNTRIALLKEASELNRETVKL
jgi:hypothetical protein